jgi:peptidoglycan/xylan/chitin deacetylase (PgdA/CDA1 family)
MTLRQLNIVPIVMLALLIPAIMYYPAIKWWGFAFIFLFQLAIVVYGCMNISSGYFLPVLCKARTADKVVALSFDDGPHPIFTCRILDTLKEHNVAATFFCIGKNISGNEAILQQLHTEGHTIGNHTYSHGFWFDMWGSKKMLADMQQMDEQVNRVIGSKPILFRPPYGVTNPNLKKAVTTGRYIPIGWSVRSLDTAIKDKQKLLSRITGELKPGDIILLHDSMEITAQLLPEIIEQIQKQGYRIERLDKMLNVNAYA